MYRLGSLLVLVRCLLILALSYPACILGFIYAFLAIGWDTGYQGGLKFIATPKKR